MRRPCAAASSRRSATARPWRERDARRLVSFSCNDYLGLSHDPRVVAAARRAVADYGAGSGGSRLVTGNHPLLTALEARLAAHKGTEAALVFGSGYLANLGITPALVGAGDLILIDELAHACMWGGARMSGASVLTFRHNDVADLARLLSEHRATASQGDDPHGAGVQHGRRPGAARRHPASRRDPRRLDAGGRRARTRNRRGRPARTARDGHPVEVARRRMAAISARRAPSSIC